MRGNAFSASVNQRGTTLRGIERQEGYKDWVDERGGGRVESQHFLAL